MQRKGRVRVRLFCIVCESRNYTVMKQPNAERGTLVLRKHCPACNSHTEHREGK